MAHPPLRLDLPMSDIFLYHDVNLGTASQELFWDLYRNIPWEQKSIHIYGKDHPQPRLISWHGDEAYTYSGLRLEPKPWTGQLSALKKIMQGLTGEQFNGVLLNLYRDGNDSIGFHSDNEPEFGRHPTIASLSLGEQRPLQLRRKDKAEPMSEIPLPHGSVLVMSGITQDYWEHGIPKTKKTIGPRINLTFRNIVHPR